MPHFPENKKKVSQNVSSVAVVVVAFRVESAVVTCVLKYIIILMMFYNFCSIHSLST